MVYRTAPLSVALNDFKAGHSLTLNISDLAKDMVTVTIEGE